MINYIEILDIIKSKNVELRHDVDISLISALNIANLEKNMGIKSIYYLRFDSDYYNLLSQSNNDIIQFLLDNHEIGCHVDSSKIESYGDLLDYLDRFNKIIPFKKFTFHLNTNKSKYFGEVQGYINKSILTNEYISDSKNIFSERDVMKIKELSNYTLLLHPEWWDNTNWEFSPNGYDSLTKSLRLNDLTAKVVKEILNL